MAHLIEHYDMGVVWGKTWHRLPQYIQQDGPVRTDQVHAVLDFPIRKDRSYRLMNKDGEQTVVEPLRSWHVVRVDTNTVIAPYVGEIFSAVSHLDMFKAVDKGLLSQFPDLDIESVGTLRGGGTAFINLKVSETHILGDNSPTITRLMFYNPIGVGGYTCGVHNVRVVCNNTLMAAKAQAAALGSLKMIRHTPGAIKALNYALVDMAKIKLGLETLDEQLNVLAGIPMTSRDTRDFLKELIPMPEKISSPARAGRLRKHSEILAQFERGLALSPATARSRYGMLQAVTYWTGHQVPTAKQDRMAVDWDNLTGFRARFKNQALHLLSQGLRANTE